MNFDVVILGETMLRLTPPNHLRLEQARSLQVEVGGSESNTAIGLSRLGLNVCWLSRLPVHPLGRLIAMEITAHGVDTSWVRWVGDERLGIYFYEEGSIPRSGQAYYDRANSAMSNMQPRELPSSLFQSGRARLFHTTGITVGLSKTTEATTNHAVEKAKKSHWKISFDFNFRAKLWGIDEAFQKCSRIMNMADVLFIAERDAKKSFNLAKESEPEEILDILAKKFPQALVVLTRGGAGAVARTPEGECFSQPIFPAEEIGRLGRGDAFSAGFLYSWLSQDSTHDLSNCLAWGAAMASLKSTVPGDIPWVDKDMVENLLNQKGSILSLER